jgi:hypothetical protein
MTRLTALVLCTTVLSTSLAAQTHPDLSGDWVLNRDKTAAVTDAHRSSSSSTPSASVSGGGGGGGVAMMGQGPVAPPEYLITLTAASITVDRVAVTTPQKYVYKLDGSDSVNAVGPTTSKTKTHWDGARLVTEGTRSVTTSQGDVSSLFKEVRSLDKDGAMIVEQTRQSQNQEPLTTYQVFVRKPKG